LQAEGLSAADDAAEAFFAAHRAKKKQTEDAKATGKVQAEGLSAADDAAEAFFAANRAKKKQTEDAKATGKLQAEGLSAADDKSGCKRNAEQALLDVPATSCLQAAEDFFNARRMQRAAKEELEPSADNLQTSMLPHVLDSNESIQGCSGNAPSATTRNSDNGVSAPKDSKPSDPSLSEQGQAKGEGEAAKVTNQKKFVFV